MAATKQARRAAGRGFATRTAERRHRMRQRVQMAGTAEEQLSAAFDWFRSSARHLPVAADRMQEMRQMAQSLAAAAERVERERDSA